MSSNAKQLAEALQLLLKEIKLTDLDHAALISQLTSIPSATVSSQELKQASEDGSSTRFALLTAIILMTDVQRFAEIIQPLLAYLSAHEASLDDFDSARYWHLQGVFAWKRDDDHLRALKAFLYSVDLLERFDRTHAQIYLGRVWNSIGQFKQYQGRFLEARYCYEKALEYKKHSKDLAEKAFALGNLARVCIDVGDYEYALDYLNQDLDIVQSASSNDPVVVQLLSEIGHCYLETGHYEKALTYYAKSEGLAVHHNSTIGLIFARLGLCRTSLQLKNDDEIDRKLDEISQLLAGSDFSPGMVTEFNAQLNELKGDMAFGKGQFESAIPLYQLAHQLITSSSTAIPGEIARLLNKIANAQMKSGYEKQSSATLRKALNCIDSTALDEQRAELERRLKEQSPQQWMLHAAGRFIGQQQIETYLEQAGKRGFRGRKKQMLVLFSDIRDFTTLAEKLDPEELVKLLNKFLTRMTRAIELNGGIVDKFIGDAIMALFPLDTGKEFSQAADAALFMQAEMDFLNHEISSSGIKLEIGIGLHSGELVSGLIGSPQKRSYTVIGDTVNTASRLEGMTKILGSSILVSEVVANKIDQEHYLLRPLGKFTPKGRTEPLQVFDLMGLDDGSLQAVRVKSEIADCAEYNSLIQCGDSDKAKKSLQRLIESTNCKTRVRGYLAILDLLNSHHEDDWNNGFSLSQK